MELAGQPFDFAHGKPFDLAHVGGNRGYAMAALLIGMSVMAVLMSAILPVWTHMATREKEEELIFRGNQYARAIGLFQRKFANTAPPTIDVLVEQRFLRKKYKDPITKDDFQPLYANQAMPGAIGGPSGAAGSTGATTRQPTGQVIQSGFNNTGATGAGGIVGVTSKSKETSIKVYNGRTKYNEWAFVYVQTSQRPGQPGPGQPAMGGQGGPNQQRPGGQQPFGMQPGAMPPGGRPMGPGGQQSNPSGNQPRPGMGSPFSPNTQPFNPGRPPAQRPPGQ
jgi:type II secretory pathway pseudopilin PulG